VIDTIVAPSLHFVLLTKTRETQHTLHLKRTICYRRPRIPTWDQDWTGIPREEPIIEKAFSQHHRFVLAPTVGKPHILATSSLPPTRWLSYLTPPRQFRLA
jgi:hypothetical protein